MKKAEFPVLILQGERDYQVTMEDFQNWKDALEQNDNVSFISYPDLNHLFISGEGESTPEEYMIEGHMSGVVLEDIVKWIDNN
ncbi:MAG: dienelactone hydrolase family protein [bacterium]